MDWFQKLLAAIFKHAIEDLRVEFRAELSAKIAAARAAAMTETASVRQELSAQTTQTTQIEALIAEAIADCREDVSSEFRRVGLAVAETRQVIEMLDHRTKMIQLEQRVEQIRTPEPKHVPLVEKKPAGQVDLLEHEFGNPVRFEVERNICAHLDS
jgi:hypothetical protein